jgi:hypothetical protein
MHLQVVRRKSLTKHATSEKSQLTLHQVQAWLEGTVYDSKPAYMNLSIVQISRRLPDGD